MVNPMKTKQQRSMQELWKDSYLSGGNDAYLEELYETYLKNPEELSPEWQRFFKQLARSSNDVPHSAVRNEFLQIVRQPKTVAVQGAMSAGQERQQERSEERRV